MCPGSWGPRGHETPPGGPSGDGALGFEFGAAAGGVCGIIIPAEGVGFYGADGLLEQKLLVVEPMVCLPLYWKRRLGGDITAS